MRFSRCTFSLGLLVLLLCSRFDLHAGTICPAVGFANAGASGTGCYVVFTFNANGTITRSIDTTVGRYDSIDGDDITVGVVNLTQSVITRLDLTTTNPNGNFSGFGIMNFDGDGICSTVIGPPRPSGCPGTLGPGPGPYGIVPFAGPDYAGPDVTGYTRLNNSEGTVFLNVPPSITAISSTYFGLEDVPDGHAPEPAPFVFLVTGAGVLVLFHRVQSRTK
jgi:hypothetical protein